MRPSPPSNSRRRSTADKPDSHVRASGIKKTEQQKKADIHFIKTVTVGAVTCEQQSKEFAATGWHCLQQRDRATSMRQFNQSYLLDTGYYMPYWGFAVLLNMQGKASAALGHFDKALSLIDDEKEKP